MDGVKVLDVVEIMDNTINWFWFGIVVVCLMAGFVALCTVLATKQNDKTWYLMLILFAVLSIAVGLIVGLATGDQYVKEFHYKVLLEENVDMQSFLDTYEIIEQEGQILTIKEK